MLFWLLPVPLCVMKLFMHVNGLQSQTLKVHPVASSERTPRWRFLLFHLFPEQKWTNPRSSSHTVTIKRSGGTFSVHFQLTGSPIDLHRAPWLVIDELGSRRNALRRSILTAFINLFLTQYQATLIFFTSLF